MYLNRQDDTKSLWATNFGIRVVLALFVILQTGLFYMSYRRIAHVKRTLTHEANERILTFAKRTITSFIICLGCLTIFESFGLIT